MSQEKILVKKGQFYFIYNEDTKNYVLEDKTKRGLPVIESTIDPSTGLLAERGRFYDSNGRGHVMPVRWYFPKEKYTLAQVCEFADKLDNHYRTIMEDTCPDY